MAKPRRPVVSAVADLLAALDVGRATSLPIDVRGLAPATYFVHVVAANACGASAPSNEVVVEVP